MCTGSHVDAWKAVIDFSKVVLTFASAVIVALIGYYLTKDVRPSVASVLPLLCLVSSAVLSLFGFGRGIVAVKTGISQKTGLLFCNLGAIALLVGTLLAFFLPPLASNNFSSAMKNALHELKQANIAFDKKMLKECTYKAGTLKIVFDVTTGVKEVIYDEKEKTITNLNIIP